MSTTTSPDVYRPAPGTEYPFSVSDIARATAPLLGADWHAESGPWGTTGRLSGPFIATFEIVVDEGDLCLTFTRYLNDGWPQGPELPEGVDVFDGGLWFPDACSVDGLEALSAKVAATIRALITHSTRVQPADLAAAAAQILGGDWGYELDPDGARSHLRRDDEQFTVTLTEGEVCVRDASDNERMRFRGDLDTPALPRQVARAVSILHARPSAHHLPNPYLVAEAAVALLGDQCGAHPGRISGTARIRNQDATWFSVERFGNGLGIRNEDDDRHALLPIVGVDTAARALAEQIGGLF
ncbi:hypothetical protein ABZV65_30520 [Streptomyces bauhiniae]|uniref:hypothetical protein n=1 Tax=Streptomyces bauhiniae TaxID=2340725 RepID=UPI0033BCA00F